MDALERIRSCISAFAGYAEAEHRRLSDEQIRSFVGEVLAELAAADIDSLAADERTHYDRVLLRCEFINQEAFRIFDTDPTPQRIAATLVADVDVVEAASILRSQQDAALAGVVLKLSEAFDRRDAAMQIA